MSTLVLDKTIAEDSGSGAIALGGRARDGKRSYVQYEIFGGVDGRNGKDGASATSFHLKNGMIAPVETVKSEFVDLVFRTNSPARHLQVLRPHCQLSQRSPLRAHSFPPSLPASPNNFLAILG